MLIQWWIVYPILFHLFFCFTSTSFLQFQGKYCDGSSTFDKTLFDAGLFRSQFSSWKGRFNFDMYTIIMSPYWVEFTFGFLFGWCLFGRRTRIRKCVWFLSNMYPWWSRFRWIGSNWCARRFLIGRQAIDTAVYCWRIRCFQTVHPIGTRTLCQWHLIRHFGRLWRWSGLPLVRFSCFEWWDFGNAGRWWIHHGCWIVSYLIFTIWGNLENFYWLRSYAERWAGGGGSAKSRNNINFDVQICWLRVFLPRIRRDFKWQIVHRCASVICVDGIKRPLSLQKQMKI